MSSAAVVIGALTVRTASLHLRKWIESRKTMQKINGTINNVHNGEQGIK